MSQGTESTIDVSNAIDAAFKFLEGTVGAKEKILDIRLEEVDFVDDDHHWLITLSFLREIAVEAVDIDVMTELAKAITRPGKKYRRVYKACAVDATSGHVRSMKIRTPY